MKSMLKLLVVATLIHYSVALLGHNLNGAKKNKYRLHREPPVDESAKFVDEEIVETRWIEQRLNNFDPQDRRTWQMRYLENNFYLQDGGPIFIYVGGEWTVSAGWLRTGHMHDMARDLNGTMFYTEHRYYGQSRPTPDLTVENLRFLNIDQALADLAHFITHIKNTIPEVRNSGVILVGASYSATMVTWFMQKYPHLANGAWSSSAPLLAKVDFVEYKEVVSFAFEEQGGSNCTGRIRRGFEELEALVARGDSDRIEELFQLCFSFDLTNQLDVWSFFADIAGPFSGIVQYYREQDQDIENECQILIDNDIENDLEALARWWWFDPANPDGPNPYCYDHRYDSWIYFFNGTSWDDIAAYYEIRQWYYQTCAEYGWYQSSGSEDILFGSSFPADLSVQLCHDLYSGIFNPEIVQQNVDRTNVIYGALNPTVRNVYSTHGQFDPWRPMGVQWDINESSPTVILPRQSHCSDLYSHRDSDTPELTASKNRISGLVELWLGIVTDPITTVDLPISSVTPPMTTLDPDPPISTLTPPMTTFVPPTTADPRSP